MPVIYTLECCKVEGKLFISLSLYSALTSGPSYPTLYNLTKGGTRYSDFKKMLLNLERNGYSGSFMKILNRKLNGVDLQISEQ